MKKLLSTLFAVALGLNLSAQVPDYVPTEGLVGWWPLDGNGADESESENHGTVYGALSASDRWNEENSCMNFLNYGDRIELGEISTSIGAPYNGLTISCWFKGGAAQENNRSGQLVAANYGPGSYQIRLEVVHDIVNGPGNHLKYYWRCPNENDEPVSESEFGTDTWNNYVMVVDPNLEEITIFLNGAEITDLNATYNPANNYFAENNRNWMIGAVYPSVNSMAHQFFGTIDDIGIWNRALTEEEILALYNAPAPAPGCTDSTACNFDSEATSDDGSCVILPSLVLPADTVTFEPSLTLEASSEGALTYVYLWNTGDTAQSIEVIESGLYSVQVMQEESVNRSVRFDAVSTELADFSSVTSAFGNEGTIAIDFKIETPNSFEPDLAGNWSLPSYPLFYLDNGAHDPLAIRIGRGCYANEASITLEDDDCGQSNPHVRASWGMDPLHFFDGEWHRMVLSSGSQGHALYVDGNLLPLDYTMGNPSINVWPEDADVFNLGRELNADWDFVGELDNLSVWSFPLHSNQATTFNPCQITQLTSGLLGFWSFNEDDSSSAMDASGNEQHGMVNADRLLQSAQSACVPCFAEGTVMVQLLESGCTDSTACNFDSEATSDDGSCIPSGCMEPLACNYNAIAECEGEECVYSCCSGPGCCLEGTTWDADLGGCIPTESSCPEDLDFDGVVGVNDLMELLSSFGTMCEEPETGEFTCGEPMNYHGYDYATVQIGDQCWFAENLRNEHYANGDAIPGGLTDGEWGSTTEGAQAVYNNDASNLSDYGRLYNWHAADDARGLCPSGWHVPTDGEFMTLELELGMSESEANAEGYRGTDQGTQMKSSPEDDPSWNGTNTSGFSGLAGGARSYVGDFSNEGINGYFWSATADGADTWSRVLNGGNTGVNRYNYGDLRGGFSVRCLKDSEE